MAEHIPNPPLNTHATRKSGSTHPRFDSLASRRPEIRLAIATRVDALASSTSEGMRAGCALACFGKLRDY
eukprot:15443152-Alexandrium_andersonii.AAC.1